MQSFKEYFQTENSYHQDTIDVSHKWLAKLPDYSNLKISGSFLCYDNYIPSLIGSPSSVGGDFDCSENDLKTLAGAPKIVNGSFKCSGNVFLKILKDSGLDYIGHNMYLDNCPNIQEDQWQYLPIIQGTLYTDKDLNRNEILTLQRLKALDRIGKLYLSGKIEQSKDDEDPFNL
jgi:hypothetical protein